MRGPCEHQKRSHLVQNITWAPGGGGGGGTPIDRSMRTPHNPFRVKPQCLVISKCRYPQTSLVLHIFTFYSTKQVTLR